MSAPSFKRNSRTACLFSPPEYLKIVSILVCFGYRAIYELTWSNVYPFMSIRSKGEACLEAKSLCRPWMSPDPARSTAFDSSGIELYVRKIHCQPSGNFRPLISKALVVTQGGKEARHTKALSRKLWEFLRTAIPAVEYCLFVGHNIGCLLWPPGSGISYSKASIEESFCWRTISWAINSGRVCKRALNEDVNFFISK
jgi:hypothetical protein